MVKGSFDPDWRNENLIGAAFLDNARDIPTLISDGHRDLVVPESALASALRAISGTTTVTETPSELTLGYPDGLLMLAIRHYPSAGHMITMIEPKPFAAYVRAWLTLN